MTDVFSTVPTPWLLAAEQAFAAGGPAINLGAGTLKVGDGNGAVPTASAIVANGGVLHQVWQGPVNGGEVDPANALQININCLIPTVDGAGAEIGPFTVREFAIYDVGGNLALVGTTNLPKTVSSSGQLTTLQWWACYAAAVANSITVQPPSGSWPTLGQIQTGVAGLLSASAPLSVTSTLQSSGWTSWLISIASATMSALGIGRPATDAEFVAGAPAGGGYAFPWVRIEQVVGALNALKAYVDTSSQPITVSMSAPISVSNGAYTTIGTLSGAGNAALAVASSMITVEQSGTYQINASLAGGVTTSGAAYPFVGVTIVLNGLPKAANSTTGAVGAAATNYTMVASTGTLRHLSVGDAISLIGDAGSGTNFSSAQLLSLDLSMYRIGS